ncbi:MAG TPA: hypothetical protein VGD40_05980, partial [Chryseosolibacter sp.]
RSCPTGKIVYASTSIAEDVLIELWSKNDYHAASAPVAIYQCDDCGFYHLTSRGPMNEKLSAAIASGQIKRQREANRWEDKFKKR